MDFPGRFDSLGAFLAMGGYGAFVWPALALTMLVLGGIWLQSLAALRAAKRQEAMVGRLRRAAGPARSAGQDAGGRKGGEQVDDA